MITGEVVRWDRVRGYGFAKRDDGQPDVFIHACALRDQSRDHLEIGKRVQFDVQTDQRNGKLRAIKVVELATNGGHRPSPRESAQAHFRDA